MRKERAAANDVHVFRSLEERSFDFATAIVRLIKEFNETLPSHIADRLLALGTEIGHEVHAAETTRSRRQSLKHTEAARVASRDLGYWLRLAAASDLFPPELLQSFLLETAELGELLKTLCAKKRHESEQI